MKVKIKLPDGTYIERKPRAVAFGNFQMLIIRYKNEDYLVGDGDEYLHGIPEYFTLGRKLEK